MGKLPEGKVAKTNFFWLNGNPGKRQKIVWSSWEEKTGENFIFFCYFFHPKRAHILSHSVYAQRVKMFKQGTFFTQIQAYLGVF